MAWHMHDVAKYMPKQGRVATTIPLPQHIKLKKITCI